jgi:protease I
MQKSKFLIFGTISIMVIGFLVYQNLTKKEIIMPKTLENKKIVIIVAFRDFRDEEYFVPKEILEKAGAEIKTASNRIGTAIGADGGEVKVDFLVSEINQAEFDDLQHKSSHNSIQSISFFDAVVFIGGPGCLENLDNESSYQVAKDTVLQGKVLASICISPVILAKAGVLKGKKATVWSSALDKSAIEILEENEAIFEDKLVVADGKIITGNGPAATEEFGMKVVEVLAQ